MTRSQAAHTDHMDIGIDCLLGHLGGHAEEWTNVHVKAQISKATSNHLCTTVMAILTHLGHQDAGSPSVVFSKILYSINVKPEIMI